MNKRIVTFGDSWTHGACADLYNLDPNFARNNQIDTTTMCFKNPWPVLLSKKLNVNLKNLSHWGCSNKSIVSMLYDSYILGDLNPNSDFVIILFSTWHREAVWTENAELTFNSKFFKNSCDHYTSSSILDNTSHKDISEETFKKVACEMFLNFYAAINFLESKKIGYKIGWGFTFIEDFQDYLDKKYVRIIKDNPNLIDTMINYCKSFKGWENLLHPNQEDHECYASYLHKKLVNEKLFS